MQHDDILWIIILLWIYSFLLVRIFRQKWYVPLLVCNFFFWRVCKCVIRCKVWAPLWSEFHPCKKLLLITSPACPSLSPVLANPISIPISIVIAETGVNLVRVLLDLQGTPAALGRVGKRGRSEQLERQRVENRVVNPTSWKIAHCYSRLSHTRPVKMWRLQIVLLCEHSGAVCLKAIKVNLTDLRLWQYLCSLSCTFRFWSIFCGIYYSLKGVVFPRFLSRKRSLLTMPYGIYMLSEFNHPKDIQNLVAVNIAIE